MNCLELAERLAERQSLGCMSSSLSPVGKKLRACTKKTAKENTIPENLLPTTVLKPVVRLRDSSHDYIPPFSRVFEDKNLRRYFDRFLIGEGLNGVVTFIDGIRKYKDNFSSVPEKQAAKHKETLDLLRLLPSDYVAAILGSYEEMSEVSITAFDYCLQIIMDLLRNEEFEGFLDSRYYVEWTLKYHNTEKD
jgi:hypothetical protein